MESGGWSPASASIVAHTEAASASSAYPPSRTAPTGAPVRSPSPPDVSRHLSERGGLEVAATQPVVAVGVVPGRDEHEVGLELLSGGDHDVLEQLEPPVLV